MRGPFRVDQQALWLEGSQGAVFALDPGSDPPRVPARWGRAPDYVLPAGEREGESCSCSRPVSGVSASRSARGGPRAA
ncbi:MAG: hypothetical protein IPG96_08120 [Proteobacteria bacterium]|nr:hypothetical protein [Pseudomonadota bacterium]